MSHSSYPTCIKDQVVLREYSSWKVGGPADYLALPASLEEVREVYRFAASHDLPVTILGSGTNVLISDLGIRGLVLCTRELRGLTVDAQADRLSLVAWAGTPKSEVLKVFLEHRLAPAVFLTGLPGDVGGGIVMNAGVSEEVIPREFGELCDWVEVLRYQEATGESDIIRSARDKLEFTYRHSRGWQPGLIVRAGLSWPNEPDQEVPARVRQKTRHRWQSQPIDLPSGGSVFRNPPGERAGRLIDQCGLKGMTVGGAQVSTKHANFIVNTQVATAADIWGLIQRVREEVARQTGLQLETEVVRLGVFAE